MSGWRGGDITSIFKGNLQLCDFSGVGGSGMLSLTSHQQLRSYGDGPTALHTGEAGDHNGWNLHTYLSINDMLGILLPDEAPAINRGSYMSDHVLLNLLKELGKRDKMWGLPRILSLFLNSFNKFNYTEAQISDSINHMTLKLLWNHVFA